MKTKKILITILCCISLLITACSTGTSAPNDIGTSADSFSDQSEDKTTEQTQPAGPVNTQSETTWNVAQFIPLEYDFSEMGFDLEKGYVNISSTAYDSILYTFFNYQGETSEESSFWLCTFDTNTQTMENIQITPRFKEPQSYNIISADILDAETITLKLYITPDTSDSHHIMLEMDMTGGIVSTMDPCPLEEVYPWNADLRSNLKVFPIRNNNYIIRHWDSTAETSTLYQYDSENIKQTPLEQFEQEYINSLCTDGEESIYYISNGYINKYNIPSQTTEPLCNIMNLGVPRTAVTECIILLNDSGQLLLCDTTSSTPGIYYLTNKDIVVTEKAIIEFANISQFYMNYTQQYAASFSARNQTCTIQLAKVSDTELADFRDRTLIDIVAGKGPELLWVSTEDMHMLAEKGAIMDLRYLISKDTLEQLYPGVIQAGTVNDKLVGITPEVSYVTMIASDKVWNKNSWTFDEMLGVIESREWEYPFLYGTWGINNYFLFYEVFAKDWNCSPFVDMEKGVSHFDEESFIKSIQLCKKYDSSKSGFDVNELYEFIDNGDSIARICYMYNGLADFSQYMDSYQDNGHIVGFPTTNGSGNYLYSEGYLVVNANATHTEAISDFIEYLLSYENQFEVNSAPVRRDVVRDSVEYVDFLETYMQKKSATESVHAELALKADGSTYLEEYMDFVESCVPEPIKPTDITAILGEELPAYFSGSKSAESVANIIHNRVQLYFDENK